MPTTKLLLDENIGVKVANHLREKNYAVKSAVENFQGASDKQLLKTAFNEKRVIIPLDKDFAYLVFREMIPCYGIIFLRLRDESPQNINKILTAFFDNNTLRLTDKFIVLTETQVRIRNI